MQERLIWRPNSIDPAEWERMSREEQLQWWKSQQSPTSSPSPMGAIRLYERGAYTERELPAVVFERLNNDNLQEFLTKCPPDLRRLLQEAAKSYPADDDQEAWQRMIWVGSACYPPWVSVDEIEQERNESSSRLREGLRIFRSAVSEHE